ncbi:DUF6153 family protein [Streptomyces sp. S6]
MNRAEPCAVRSPLRGWPAFVCVLGVLVGLLAMHGLAPGGLHAVGHGQSGGTTAAAPESLSDGTALSGCPEDGHCGAHARHADATCAAAKVGGAPELAGPVPDPVGVVVPDEILRTAACVSRQAARAPPSLAELQLLRI